MMFSIAHKRVMIIEKSIEQKYIVKDVFQHVNNRLRTVTDKGNPTV